MVHSRGSRRLVRYEITPLVEAFIYNWALKPEMEFPHTSTNNLMNVCQYIPYWAVLHHQWNRFHGLFNPFHPCHYLLFWEFFQLVIDSSQLGLCGSQMVDLLYQSRQTRCSILEDRAQEMGCFRKVWSTAFREFMCLCVRGSMCAQTISFSSEFCRLQSRYCLLSWVKWWRKARPFLRSHNLSSSWVFCFCSRNICLSALNSHINNSQAQNHACLYK